MNIQQSARQKSADLYNESRIVLIASSSLMRAASRVIRKTNGQSWMKSWNHDIHSRQTILICTLWYFGKKSIKWDAEIWSHTQHNSNENLNDQQMSSLWYGNDLLWITGGEFRLAKTLPFKYGLNQRSKFLQNENKNTVVGKLTLTVLAFSVTTSHFLYFVSKSGTI